MALPPLTGLNKTTLVGGGGLSGRMVTLRNCTAELLSCKTTGPGVGPSVAPPVVGLGRATLFCTVTPLSTTVVRALASFTFPFHCAALNVMS